MDRELAISPRALRLIEDLRDEWGGLDRRIAVYDDELAMLTRTDEQALRLATIPGVVVINATALLAAVGDASTFSRGRDLAAGLGLTPRQHSATCSCQAAFRHVMTVRHKLKPVPATTDS